MYYQELTRGMAITDEVLTIHSTFLNREVTCSLLVPESLDELNKISLLLLNDGQELENLKLKTTLENLYNNQQIVPVLVAAIHANEERIQEYGVSGTPDFKGRGSKASAYTSFITQELLPKLQELVGLKTFNNIAFAGFSLGGLSALDIVWNNPQMFNKAGAFSGSFWWRSKDLNDGYDEAQDRIMHKMIGQKKHQPGLKFWFQTGTKDETADRNHNGIIDSLDDTVDLIKTLRHKGYDAWKDIQYLEVVNGQHNIETWSKAMPKFLRWAFSK
ncbi:alpha/beta hydrolase [Mucilaginibacter arboris]|uniref:Esterase family protein n=1 Tax=Mucilaginibacter arboris TaxID=2682090 RepID=A0A7K1SRR0_9SPHI|nr:alpha/beta hydrolase-fold protein [Mucilaginibacter arboris]MVN20009.1 esterase family protein [Mucilaginibacter arboris]